MLTVTVCCGSVAIAGCGGDGRTPKTLMDGSRPPALPIELERSAAPAVLSKVRVLAAVAVGPGSLTAECLRGRARDVRPTGRIVERIGIHGESVTLRDAAGLHGCDDSPGRQFEGRRWCGGSFGRLYDGHLRDPRLDIAGCTSADGAPVSFVWVEPRAPAHYLAVAQPGYAEVYEIAGGLPIRVTSVGGAEPDRLRVSFDLAEYDLSGHLLRRYQVDAVPAG